MQVSDFSSTEMKGEVERMRDATNERLTTNQHSVSERGCCGGTMTQAVGRAGGVRFAAPS